MWAFEGKGGLESRGDDIEDVKKTLGRLQGTMTRRW